MNLWTREKRRKKKEEARGVRGDSGLQLDPLRIPSPFMPCLFLSHSVSLNHHEKAARNHVRTTKWSRPGACDHETVCPADSSSGRWIRERESGMRRGVRANRGRRVCWENSCIRSFEVLGRTCDDQKNGTERTTRSGSE